MCYCSRYKNDLFLSRTKYLTHRWMGQLFCDKSEQLAHKARFLVVLESRRVANLCDREAAAAASAAASTTSKAPVVGWSVSQSVVDVINIYYYNRESFVFKIILHKKHNE